MRQTGNLVLYYGRNDVFSHHYPCAFYVKSTRFSCVEQFLMYCKAMLFQDLETAARVMQTDDPVMHLRLGRSVKNYNEAVWADRRGYYAYVGNLAKFSQNLNERAVLMATKDMIIAEASPTSRIWGIGLDIMHPNAGNPELWQGQNLAGRTMMEVRRELSLSDSRLVYAKVA